MRERYVDPIRRLALQFVAVPSDVPIPRTSSPKSSPVALTLFFSVLTHLKGRGERYQGCVDRLACVLACFLAFFSRFARMRAMWGAMWGAMWWAMWQTTVPFIEPPWLKEDGGCAAAPPFCSAQRRGVCGGLPRKSTLNIYKNPLCSGSSEMGQFSWGWTGSTC